MAENSVTEKAAHTPGPWHFDSDQRITAERVCVALVTRGVDPECDEHLRGPVFEANARLIAAAPELLSALRELARAWNATQFPCSERMDAALKDADEAIAKAEGRP